MNKKLIKTITYLAGAATAVLCGLMYLILSDIGFGNTAGWLLGVSLFAFGSGICQFFSQNFKENKVVLYILKSVAVALAIALVVFFYISMANEPYTTVNPDKQPARDTIVTLSLIVAYISTVIQAGDLSLNLLLKEEE